MKILHVILILIVSASAIGSSKSQDAEMESKIDTILSKMSLDEKCSILHGDTFFTSPGVDRLGVAGFNMSDGPHGVRMAKGTTAFPVTIALTATWDADIMEEVGAAYGREHRGAGTNMALGPAVDIGHDPRAGRASETVGEEPYLGGKIFAAFTRGLQSTNLIGTVKHLMAQNIDATRTETSPNMDERTMREFYALPFKMVIQEGGALSVMSSYNLVNGVHCSQSSEILNQMLRTEWGYNYFIVSDWVGTYDNPEKLINSGLDMEMPDSGKFKDLKEAVQNGKVSEETLDMSVRRTLRSRFKSGMMDKNTPKGNPKDLNSLENQKINLGAAKKAMILLKNTDNILPLKKTAKIALIGPNANDIPLTSFGSSEITSPAYKVSIRAGISNSAPNSKLTYVKGCDMNSQDTSGFDAARQAAKDSEFVIFVGGMDNTQEGEAYSERQGMDRTGGSVMLQGKQIELIKELAKVNPNIIVVLMSGGIVSIGDSVNSIKGLIYAFYCGNECGNAIAQTIFGDNNPAGRLPISMPVDDKQLPQWGNMNFSNDMIAGFGYRRFDSTGEKPIFNFGFGLSYTQFKYANLKVSNSTITGQSEVTVTVEVTNVGTRAGDEVAQLYLSPKVSVEMPVKQLRGFKRINLSSGEMKEISFKLTQNELAYWSTAEKHFVVGKGTYGVKVGGSSDNLPLSDKFTVTSDYTVPYGSYCADCKVSDVRLSPKKLFLGVGTSSTLKITFTPYNAHNQDVVFESSDPEVVEVLSTGNFRALKIGTVQVKVTTNDGGFTDVSEITVVKEQPCPEWVKGNNYPIGTVISFNGERYTSTNSWNGSAGDPYAMTHSDQGWGWKIGGECSPSFWFLQ